MNLISFKNCLPVMVLSLLPVAQVHAVELLHFIEGKQYADLISEASGLNINNQGVVFVTSDEKANLLKITDGDIEAIGLMPGIFRESDLGGVSILPNGDLVVVNRDSGKVAILDDQFELKRQFSQSGDDPGELDKPVSVAVSMNQQIYVGDSGNKQVSVFNNQGLFLYSFGRHGSGGENIQGPTHISIDADENIYLLENTSRFSIFDKAGNLLKRFDSRDLKTQFDETPEFTALGADLNGMIYLGDFASSQVVMFDWRQGKVVDRFGALGQSRAQYRNIAFLSVNNRGQIAILDKLNQKVEVFQLDQTEFKKPIFSDTIKLAKQQDSNCRSLHAFSEDHRLCIKTDKNQIVLLDNNGDEAGDFAADVKNPTALHSDSNQVAILEGNKLHVYDKQGSRLFVVGRYGTAVGGFQKPRHVFVHNSQFYVADTGNNRIQVVSSDGQFIEEIKSRVGDSQLFADLGPIAVGNSGQLYIVDKSGGGTVRVLDKGRNLIANIGMEEDSIHKMTGIHALDVDKQDRLYVLASSDFNDYGVTIYEDFQVYQRFGAEGDNGSDIYFETIGSLSVDSGLTNRIHINDSELKRHYLFDLHEYPDAAFGLKIGADYSRLNLEWNSTGAELISRFEIQAAANENGPFETIASTSDHNQSVATDAVADKRWFRIVAVSGLGLRAASSAPRENQFQNMLSLYQSGDFEQAIKLAERLLKIDAGNADVLDLLGLSLFALKDYTRVIGVYKQLEENPGYKNKAVNYQVQAHFELGQFLDARGLIDEVLAGEPAEIEPYLICTRLSLELADAIGAVTCAEDGLALHSLNVELRYLLGLAYIEAGLADEGVNAFQTIIQKNAGDDTTRLKIAGQLYRLGQYEQALEHYDYVLSRKTDSSEAAVGKARALLQLDRDDAAKSIAVKLAGKKNSKGEGNYLLGKIASKQEKHKEAVLRFTRASKETPDSVDAWVSLAESYQQIKQPGRAVKSLEQGIKHNPESFQLYLMAGRLELEAQSYSQANDYLGMAVSLQPQSLQAQKLYARSLFATRNFRSAALHADVAARLATDDLDILTLQAKIANQQGKTGSAIEFLKTAISIDSTSSELLYQIGRVYQDANLFDASRENLEKAANINPNWAAPQIALGALYSKRRLFDDAIAAIEKAIAINPSAENRATLNIAFAERKKSLEFKNNAPQLLLSDLNLQRVFSAAYKQYQDKPIGSVKLQNAAANDYGNLKLSFQIKEFMDFPSSIDIDKIGGNETRQFDIKAIFNNKILEVDEDTGVQVEVKLSYLRDGQKDEISLTQPMTIYGKNAIVWAEPKMVGSFVTPKDDTLRDYVRQVVNKYQPEPGPLNDKLVSAMAFFSSLTASGTNYIIDPNTPFTELREDQIDYVQFPRETLRLKSGDCDDLSVLISAGLENLGIHTAFLEIPGHLFLMFDTGIAADDAGLISQDDSLLAINSGRVWIPLEATMVNSSFIEAWAEGARKYQQALAQKNLGIINLAEAWQQYKPVTLAKATYSADLPEATRTRSLVEQAQKVLLAKSIDRLIKPYQVMVTNNPRNIAARLQIAILFARYGLYEDAEIAFEALDELAPDNSSVQTNQGNLYFLQKNYPQAIGNYSKAARLDQKDGGIWVNLSMAYYKAGDLKQAGSSFKQALQLNPTLKDDYTAYAKLLSQ